jgi:deoxyribodipyrimidine photolyase-related protein
MKAVMDVDPHPAKVLRLVLGDQLDAHHSWFQQVDPGIVYVMAELAQEQRYVRHHIQKTMAFFLAMERFAERVRGMGHSIRHFDLDQAAPFESLTALLAHCAAAHQATRVEYQLPDEYRLRRQLADWQPDGVEVVAVESEHFYMTEHDLKRQFKAGSAHRLEPFYRKMRTSFDGRPSAGNGILISIIKKPYPKR